MSEKQDAQSKSEDRPNHLDVTSSNKQSSDNDQDSGSLVGLEIDPEAVSYTHLTLPTTPYV